MPKAGKPVKVFALIWCRVIYSTDRHFWWRWRLGGALFFWLVEVWFGGVAIERVLARAPLILQVVKEVVLGVLGKLLLEADQALPDSFGGVSFTGQDILAPSGCG